MRVEPARVPWRIPLAFSSFVLIWSACMAREGESLGEEFEGDQAGECSDDADNDRDGSFDCGDPDCSGSSDCASASDDSNDGTVDTDDGVDSGDSIMDTDSLADSDDTSSDGCGGTPPVIEELAIVDDGMSTSDACGEEIRPQVEVQATGADADGDLHHWSLRVWWDDVIDGQVDGEYHEVASTTGDDECEAWSAAVGMRICVTGDPPFSTELEFAFVLIDDNGDNSERVFTTFTTPDANGNY